MSALITFSSDYGPTDEFVGVCHLVIARIAPDVRVVDVVHGIRGVRAGSVILTQSLPEATEGAVHLCVVDPGVGTERRAVAIVLGGGGFLVGPDNGLFFPVADHMGGAIDAYELSESWFMRETRSSTFHGRDIFAPAAAHLALGLPANDFGPSVEPASLVRLSPADVAVSNGRLEAEVVRADWYGNLQLAALSQDLTDAHLKGNVLVNGVPALVGEKFADVPSGSLLVYVNSAGALAVACNRGSAGDKLDHPMRVSITRKG